MNKSQSDIETKTIVEEEVPKNAIKKNIDAYFDTFFERFNNDSIFQISRVEFPLKVKEINSDNFELEDLTISRDKYSVIKLQNKAKNKDYTSKTILSENKAEIVIEGIDNGIMISLFFKKVNRKWKLVSWIDSST